jgi:Xaa-Pro aminopeptidase
MYHEREFFSATGGIMNEHILKRQKEALGRFGLDALVAFSMENVAYGTGYLIPSQSLNLRHRQFAVVVNGDGKTALLLTSNEAPEAEERSAIRDLRPYDQFADDPMEVLAGILKDMGVAEGRIGLEMDSLSANRWETLKTHVQRAQWEDGCEAFKYARMIKTPDELDRLRKAARIADLAQAEAHPHVHVGVTEREIYRHVVDRAIANGADNILMVQVAAGERSAYSNPTPGDYRMKRGEVVKIDTFVEVGGYLSDTGRAFVVGEANQIQRDAWARMQETMAAIHTIIRPGVSTKSLWQTFVNTFKKYDMEPAMRFLGHGLGLSLHEEPFIAAHTDTTLEEGMVFAIEPVYETRDKKMGFHLEDNVIVTSDGVENMTSHFGPDLIVLG